MEKRHDSIQVNDTVWLEQVRADRRIIMESLDEIDAELKKLISYIKEQKQVDAGYKRRVELLDKLYARRLQVTNTKLMNLKDKSDVEMAIAQIRMELEALLNEQRKGRITAGSLRRS